MVQRVLVVGLGNMGMSHALAYTRIDGYEVVGVCERRIAERKLPEALAKARSRGKAWALKRRGTSTKITAGSEIEIIKRLRRRTYLRLSGPYRRIICPASTQANIITKVIIWRKA